jgi:copper(I)-binding protein
MMVMDKIDNLRIPAGARIELKPTGLHLMIIHLLRSIKEGENVQVILYFEGGKRVTVKAAVRKWNKAG